MALPTIGVFDSGFGGLTVLRALLARIPNANYLYLGDTARLPYGSKSQQTIARYALSSAKFLHDHGATQLVIACNTASALALDDLKAALPIPITGVIAPGAQAAATAVAKTLPNSVILSEARSAQSKDLHSRDASSGEVLVLATAATVQSGAYTRALNALGLAATEKACPLLVPLVEEGWTDHPVTAEVLRIYLLEALAAAPQANSLLLGCTHYPLLKPLIARTLAQLHHPMHLIDSADATAQSVAAESAKHSVILGEAGRAAIDAVEAPASSSSSADNCTFYATDSIEKFQRLGATFLGRPLNQVHLLDLGG